MAAILRGSMLRPNSNAWFLRNKNKDDIPNIAPTKIDPAASYHALPVV